MRHRTAETSCIAFHALNAFKHTSAGVGEREKLEMKPFFISNVDIVYSSFGDDWSTKWTREEQ